VAGPRGPAIAFGQDIQRGYKQYAAFGSVDFDILPNLTITAGTRYYNYQNYQRGSVYSSFSASCYQAPVCVTGSDLDALNLKSKYTGFKSKATTDAEADCLSLMWCSCLEVRAGCSCKYGPLVFYVGCL
jgi:hypothetical protein